MEKLTFLFTTTFFPPHHIGGDATHVYHLTKELAQLGHDVHIIYLIDAYRWQRKDTPDSTSYPINDNITPHPLRSPLGNFSPVLSYITGIPFTHQNRIKKLLAEIKPDVLHHHNIAGFGPWIFNLSAPKKIYTAHDHWLICQMNGCLDFRGKLCYKPRNCAICSILSKRPPQIWRYSKVLQKNIKNIDIIISPSEYLKERLESYGIQNKIVILPNFVSTIIEPGSRLYKNPYFLYIGVLEKHKGIFNLLNIFLKLKREQKSHLLIVGDGSLNYEIDEFLIKNNCENFIKKLGRIRDFSILSNYYSNAEAVIIPSKCYENCPMVAIESIANGTPIITSNLGGLPEITKKINCSLVYKSQDHLKEIILNFSKDDYDKGNIMKIAQDNYSAKNINRYLELISSM